MATVKKLAIAAVGAALIGLGIADVKPAAAQQANLTFDDLGLAQGDPFDGNLYDDQGITFSQRDLDPANPLLSLRIGAACSTCSQPNALGSDFTFPGDNNGGIVGQLSNDQFATDFALTMFNPGYQVSVFDVGGNLLDTRVDGRVVNPDVPGERFDFSGLPVNRFETGGDFYAIDDVSFTPVPEPSSILGGVAMGIIGGGLMLRRKLKKQKLASDKISG